MKTYVEKKEQVRQEAINWQHDFENNAYDYSELSLMSSYFERMGKRYGLLKEFKENGVI